MNRQLRQASVLSLSAFLASTVFATVLSAQSGSRPPVRVRNQGSETRQGSATRGQEAPWGLEGYCPVCVIEKQEWVKGSADFVTTYDSKRYAFPGQEQLDMFLQNPAKYVPALGGDCTVCMVNMRKRVAGNIRHAAIRNSRLFLFPGEEQQKEFLANPEKYENADVAFSGQCAVCRVEMNQDVAGKPEFAAFYRSVRYLFPGDEQRKTFLANPEKYAIKPPTAADNAGSGTRGGSGNRGGSESRSEEPAADANALVAYIGKSGCAGCEFGKTPLLAPNELGLAITGDDGHVYIVENAHEEFPQIYEDRFDALQLKVVGRPVKSEGKFTWIIPTSLAKAE